MLIYLCCSHRSEKRVVDFSELEVENNVIFLLFLNTKPTKTTTFLMRKTVRAGVAGTAYGRRHRKISPCLIELMSASWKTDPPLARAEPISNIGNGSVTTYLRRGKNPLLQQLGERSKNI